MRQMMSAVLAVALTCGWLLGTTSCGELSSRERCREKCEPDRAVYDPDGDTCFCEERE